MSNKVIDAVKFLNNVSRKKDLPSNLDTTYYILLKEFKLSLKDIIELPVPYLDGILKTHSYYVKKEQAELKRSQNGSK